MLKIFVILTLSFLMNFKTAATKVVDPGEEGKKTLLGIDVDNNGVRDDVQVWIEKHPLSSNHYEFKILRNMARLYQEEIKSIANKKPSAKFTKERLMAMGCFLDTEVGINGDETIKITNELEKLIFNTKARIVVRKKISEKFHGQVVSFLNEVECRNKYFHQ